MGARSFDDARDHDLLRRVGSGDEEAFRSLFRRYGPAAKGLALRMVRQRFMAEEVVQEAFMAVWQDPRSYREDLGSFRAWLMSLVHHRAVDAIRREEAQRRRTREAEASPPSPVEDISLTVAEGIDQAAERAKVREALGSIPPEQRQVLEMMYFEGKSQSVIARELDLPLGTVKSRTLLGMRRLRGLLLEVRG